MNTRQHIERILERVPDRGDGEFAPDESGLYAAVCEEIYRIIRVAPDPDVIEMLDQVARSKGYADAREIFAYM